MTSLWKALFEAADGRILCGSHEAETMGDALGGAARMRINLEISAPPGAVMIEGPARRDRNGDLRRGTGRALLTSVGFAAKSAEIAVDRISPW